MSRDCEICRELPDVLTITTHFDSGREPETFPAVVERLVSLTGSRLGIRKCPVCGTYYGLREHITSHMGGPEYDGFETLRRYTPVGALIALAAEPLAKDELARHEAALPAAVDALREDLGSADADVRRKAAGELTRYHQLKSDWGSIEALLRDSGVRLAVLEATLGRADPPTSVLCLLESLLDDAECGEQSARLLTSINVHHEMALIPIFPALFARLDTGTPTIRGRVGEILEFHVSARWGRRDHEPADLPPPPGSEGVAPLLLRHLESPQPTWNGSWKSSTSSLARSGLCMLAYRNVAVAREILEAVSKLKRGGEDRESLERELRRWLGS